MNYDEEEPKEESGSKTSGDPEGELLEPLENINDFPFDDGEDDPDKDH